MIVERGVYFVVVVAYDLYDRVEPILLGNCPGRPVCLAAAEMLAGPAEPSAGQIASERFLTSLLPRTYYHRYVLPFLVISFQLVIFVF